MLNPMLLLFGMNRMAGKRRGSSVALWSRVEPLSVTKIS